MAGAKPLLPLFSPSAAVVTLLGVVLRVAVVLLEVALAGVVFALRSAAVGRSGPLRLVVTTQNRKVMRRHGMSFLSDGAPSGRRTSDTSHAPRPPFRSNAAFTETAQ